jgi:cobalamin biosynthesis protein CobT
MRVLFGALNKRPVTVMQGIASLLSKFNVRLLDGPNPKTDAKGTIWAPTIPEGATPEEQIKFLVNVAHESAHMSEGSDLEKQQRASDWKKLPFHVINAVDDVRIEAAQEQKYRGLKKYYLNDYEIFLKEEGPKFTQTPPDIAGKLKHALRYMIIKLRCEQLGITNTAQLTPEVQDLYDEIIGDLEDRIKGQQVFDDSIELGLKIYNRIKDRVEKEQEEKKKQEKQQQQKQQSQCSGDGQQGDGQSQPDDSGDKKDDEKDGDGDSKDGKEDKKKDGKGSGDKKGDKKEQKPGSGKSGQKKNEKLTAKEKAEAKQAAQDIMDKLESQASQLTTMQDDVGGSMQHPTERSDGPYMVAPNVQDDIRTMHEGSVSMAQESRAKGLKLLGAAGARMTKLFVTTHRPRNLYNRREGRLDMRALVADHMDTKKDVFTYKLPGAQDWAAVSFVVDLSSSMNASGKKEMAAAILSAMLYYLDRVRIPCEAIGYYNTSGNTSKWRTGPVSIRIYKRYEEPYRGAVMNRCVPYACGSTPDLDALKYAVPRLWARPEKKKILMVLADGAPGIGDGHLNYKMQRDEVTYIKAVKKAGIKVFGFGIFADLKKYYGKDFVYVDTNTLGREIVRKMTEVLNSKH